MSYPTWEEIFNKPPLSTCTVECPPAWQGNSIAVELADREIMRIGENYCLYDPPITEEEIDRYARHFKMTKRQAELEIREGRESLYANSYRQAA